MANITIYTKTNCTYCVQAKRLLDSLNLAYDEKSLDDNVVKENLLYRFPHVKTAPQIVVNGTLLEGGYTGLKNYIDNHSLDESTDVLGLFAS
jgi:glutaredoxin 3